VSPRLSQFLAILGVLVGAGLIAAGPPVGVDYANISEIGNNAAAPSIEALARGDLGAFFAQQPMMGSLSLVLRAPFVAVADPLGGKLLMEYRLGVFPCVVALGLLGLGLARLIPGPDQWPIRLLVFGLVIAGPPTFKALYWGHPEELLAAALAVGAVLVAPKRAGLAALMLGGALATKQWALLAVIPVLVAAAPEKRLRTVVTAGAVALAFAAPMAIGDLDRFVDQNRAAGHAGPGVTASSLWWAFGDVVHTETLPTGKEVHNYAIPKAITRAAEPLALIVTFGLSLLFWRRRACYGPADALTLLALVMLLRCILDPMTISYHHAPFYVALAASEVLRTRKLPVLTLVAAGVLLGTAQLATTPDLLNALYLAWSIPLAGFLGVTLFARSLLGSARSWAPTATP
jgi:hypothetical protein